MMQRTGDRSDSGVAPGLAAAAAWSWRLLVVAAVTADAVPVVAFDWALLDEHHRIADERITREG